MIIFSFILLWIGMLIGLIINSLDIIVFNGFSLVSIILLHILYNIKDK